MKPNRNTANSRTADVSPIVLTVQGHDHDVLTMNLKAPPDQPWSCTLYVEISVEYSPKLQDDTELKLVFPRNSKLFKGKVIALEPGKDIGENKKRFRLSVAHPWFTKWKEKDSAWLERLKPTQLLQNVLQRTDSLTHSNPWQDFSQEEQDKLPFIQRAFQYRESFLSFCRRHMIAIGAYPDFQAEMGNQLCMRSLSRPAPPPDECWTLVFQTGSLLHQEQSNTLLVQKHWIEHEEYMLVHAFCAVLNPGTILRTQNSADDEDLWMIAQSEFHCELHLGEPLLGQYLLEKVNAPDSTGGYKFHLSAPLHPPPGMLQARIAGSPGDPAVLDDGRYPVVFGFQGQWNVCRSGLWASQAGLGEDSGWQAPWYGQVPVLLGFSDECPESLSILHALPDRQYPPRIFAGDPYRHVLQTQNGRGLHIREAKDPGLRLGSSLNSALEMQDQKQQLRLVSHREKFELQMDSLKGLFHIRGGEDLRLMMQRENGSISLRSAGNVLRMNRKEFILKIAGTSIRIDKDGLRIRSPQNCELKTERKLSFEASRIENKAPKFRVRCEKRLRLQSDFFSQEAGKNLLKGNRNFLTEAGNLKIKSRLNSEIKAGTLLKLKGKMIFLN